MKAEKWQESLIISYQPSWTRASDGSLVNFTHMFLIIVNKTIQQLV